MKIEFEVQTDYGLYRDALCFPDGESLPDQMTIETMKAERVKNWIAGITAPPEELTHG